MNSKPDRQQQAAAILAAVGGAANVASHTHCMTRLRLGLQRPGDARLDELKGLPGVLGVVEGDSLQIILGPGHVQPVAEALGGLLAAGQTSLADLHARSQTLQQTRQTRNRHPVRQFLRKISGIFVPMIPALIGAGLINAFAGVLRTLIVTHSLTASWLGTLATVSSLVGSAFFAFLIVQAGINTAKEFGGTPALGGAVTSIILLPALKDMPAFTLPGLGQVVLRPGQGGLMGAVLAAALLSWLERRIRARVPPALDTLVTPTVSLLVSGVAVLYLIMPVASVLSGAVGQSATWLLHEGGMLAAFALATSFLGLLMFGLHQALIPIHAELIAQYGYTALFPVLAMAGCGHAGCAMALYARLKNPELRKVIRNTLPICMLGIGEPLLYGVTLPLGRPLITASLGGGIGAVVLGYYASQGHYIGSSTIGPANLMLIPLVTGPLGIAGSIAAYCLAAAVAYFAGFVLTWLFGLSADHLARFGSAGPGSGH